ncbi:cell division regulator GpsB [Salsuginibacillus kocurii]|uniref:cell division regulator GpsB n=1 Tax=Salsuginibacillus kocurii TaxID=427078 RepID=UPI00035F1E1D
MASSIQLTAKDILDKEFKSSMKGYNKDDVDQFLDIVIQDYETFQDQLKSLEHEVERLKKQTSQPPRRSQETQATTEQSPPPAAGSTNYDILRRLSNLEKEVFGSKLHES